MAVARLTAQRLPDAEARRGMEDLSDPVALDELEQAPT
jgi:hypothetical protein